MRSKNVAFQNDSRSKNIQSLMLILQIVSRNVNVREDRTLLDSLEVEEKMET
jgi:hypothetical protein